MPDYGNVASVTGPLPDLVFNTWGRNTLDNCMPARRNGNFLNNAPLVANQAILIPFTLDRDATAYKIAVANGSAVAGNLDVGIYDESFVRKVSMGSTAASGTNVFQEFDIANTLLVAGIYYMALSANTGAGMNVGHLALFGPTTGMLKLTGIVQMAAAFPLPDPITPAMPTYGIVPLMQVYFRASP